MTTQQKIAKCLELALQIEGANFDYHPDAESLNVFAWSDKLDADGVREYSLHYHAYTSQWADTSKDHSLDSMISKLESRVSDSKRNDTFINAYQQGDSIVFNYGLNGEFGQSVALKDLYQYIIEKGYNTVQISEDDYRCTSVVHCLSDNFKSITEEYFKEVMIGKLTYNEVL